MQNLNELGIKKRGDPFQAQMQVQEQFQTKRKLPKIWFFFYFPGEILLILSADMCSNISIILLITILGR